MSKVSSRCTRVALLLSMMVAGSGCAVELTEESQLDQDVSTQAVPNPPASLTITNYECYGANGASWSTTPNTAYYALYYSTSHLFTNPSLLYDGPNTFEGFNVDITGPWYLRVKACNVEGCSDYGPQATARRFRTCI